MRFPRAQSSSLAGDSAASPAAAREVRGLVWLVGESNPYGSDVAFALYPEPPGSAGDRLRRLWGGGEEDYLWRFERRNLLCGSGWSAPAARRSASALLALAAAEDVLVLLGARVAAAFGVPYEPLSRVSVGERGVAALVLPHPSGRNRAWIEPGLWARAGAALREVAPISASSWVQVLGGELGRGGRRYRRSGSTATCLECGWVREGTISWAVAHERHHGGERGAGDEEVFDESSR